MIFNRTTHEDLRDTFCHAVTKVFGSSTAFLDFLENARYSDKYDCFIDYSGENYIINRETGEYINWYKFTHLGRCINVSAWSPHEFSYPHLLYQLLLYEKILAKWIEDFLTEFKESEG